MTKLMRYLDENFEKESENMDKHVKSEKKISEYFVNIIKSIHLHFPDLRNHSCLETFHTSQE